MIALNGYNLQSPGNRMVIMTIVMDDGVAGGFGLDWIGVIECSL